MTREHTLAIMAVLKAAYPGYYRDMKRNDAERIVDLWTEMFKDEPAELVTMAVKTHIASDKKGFPPHIGAIKDAVLKIKSPETMTELEAWSLVRRAIDNASISPSSRVFRNGELDRRTSAERNFDQLPETLQRLVGSANQLAEWAMMDGAVVNSVVASNFQRSYRARADQIREQLALPGDVRSAMADLTGKMELPALEENREE